jgi:hypothetical protein
MCNHLSVFAGNSVKYILDRKGRYSYTSPHKKEILVKSLNAEQGTMIDPLLCLTDSVDPASPKLLAGTKHTSGGYRADI